MDLLTAKRAEWDLTTLFNGDDDLEIENLLIETENLARKLGKID